MTDWETANENRLEWAEERRRGFDIEINSEENIAGQGETCHVRKCQLPAVKRYEIKRVSAPGSGTDVDLCEDHDSDENAFEVYHTGGVL